MGKKLSEEEIEARMEAYEQAASALEGDWCDTETERAQGVIVAKEIRATAHRWYTRTTNAR